MKKVSDRSVWKTDSYGAFQLHHDDLWTYLCFRRYVSSVSKRQLESIKTTSSLHSWDISSHTSIQQPLQKESNLSEKKEYTRVKHFKKVSKGLLDFTWLFPGKVHNGKWSYTCCPSCGLHYFSYMYLTSLNWNCYCSLHCSTVQYKA